MFAIYLWFVDLAQVMVSISFKLFFFQICTEVILQL